MGSKDIASTQFYPVECFRAVRIGWTIFLKALYLFISIIIPLDAFSQTQNEIVLGMSTALSGPTAYLGVNMRDGVEAALDEINEKGGIHGYTLRLICLDDGYEPKRTIPNIYRLVEREKVLSIIGNVGTPTAVTAIPIVQKLKVLFFGAYTGAGVLRKTPPDRYVINYRASYAEETASMIQHLIESANLQPEEIAFFTQRDAFGEAGYSGGINALKKYGLKNEWKIAHGRYDRNTLAVENALADLLMHPVTPKAIILYGTYAPCAKFIRLAKENGLDAIFMIGSFVGSEQYLAEVGESGEDTFIMQVVPHYELDIPIAKRYLNAIRQIDAQMQPTFTSFEGYICAQIFFLALQSANPPFDRESIVCVMESLGEFDIGLNFPLSINPSEHQASHQVWPTVVQDGEIRPFDWNALGSFTDLRKENTTFRSK